MRLVRRYQIELVRISKIAQVARRWPAMHEVGEIGTLLLAGSIYFPLNSALVAVVLGLVSGESFRQIFARSERLVFPYFMCGFVFSALATSGYSSSWKAAVILIPALTLAHLYFQNRTASLLTVKTTS